MFSDKRLKDNIKEIKQEECLKTINHLKPVHFNFKESDKINFGFIAQDVERIVPEIINYIDKFVPDYFATIQCENNKLYLDRENYCEKGDVLRLMCKNQPGPIEVEVWDVLNKTVYLPQLLKWNIEKWRIFSLW